MSDFIDLSSPSPVSKKRPRDAELSFGQADGTVEDLTSPPRKRSKADEVKDLKFLKKTYQDHFACKIVEIEEDQKRERKAAREAAAEKRLWERVRVDHFKAIKRTCSRCKGAVCGKAYLTDTSSAKYGTGFWPCKNPVCYRKDLVGKHNFVPM
jgi:hypothetical protein